jgi:hypothetical protein
LSQSGIAARINYERNKRIIEIDAPIPLYPYLSERIPNKGAKTMPAIDGIALKFI